MRCPMGMRLPMVLLLAACATAHVVPSEPALPDPATPDPELEAQISQVAGRVTSPGTELELARALERRRLPFAAFIYYDTVLRGGGPLDAVAGLVRIQAKLRDEYLIPNELNKYY